MRKKKVDRRWLPSEDDLLRREYKQYGDAERLSPYLQFRSPAAIIKRANWLGFVTRRPEATPYTIDELKENTRIDANGCWNWLGDTRQGKANDPRGVLIHGGKRMAAHRVMFMLSKPIVNIDDLLVCHHCDNGLCINPDHLYAGTYTDNNRDTVRRGRYRNQYGPLKHENYRRDSPVS